MSCIMVRFCFLSLKIFAVRTLRAITFVSAFPYRKIQIVLRLYKTLAEVLHGFDVDACSIGFDGHTVRRDGGLMIWNQILEIGVASWMCFSLYMVLL